MVIVKIMMDFLSVSVLVGLLSWEAWSVEWPSL